MRQQSENLTYDTYLVGVGGQGVLTMADLMAETAVESGQEVSFYPTKGMAQRGGGVKVQVRFGRRVIGPEVPEKGADLAIGMERSEALKALPYVKPGSDFLLYGHVWEPTKVMLGKAHYPTLEQVVEKILAAGAVLRYVDPEQLPCHNGRTVPANIYVLGAAVGQTALGQVLDADDVARVVVERWERYAAVNEAAFRAGLEASVDGL